MKPSELKISIGKNTINKVNEAINDLRFNARRKTITLSSMLIDDKVIETQGELFEMFATGDNDLKEKAEQFINETCDKYKELTPDNYKQFIADIEAKKEYFKQFWVFKDERKTEADLRQQEADRKAEIERAKPEIEAQEEQNRRLKARFNQNNRLIMIAECYDDSDGMTDYYNPCAYSKEWVLCEVPQGKRDLRILREAISKYPSLNKLKWVEHRENHSMNRFGYSLTSEAIDLTEPKKVYRGGTATKGFYKVDFGSIAYDGTKEVYPEKQEATENKVFSFSEEVSISKNEKLNGLEVGFKAKPSQEVLNLLKSNGFRWSNFNKIWYKRYYEGLEQEVKALLNIA